MTIDAKKLWILLGEATKRPWKQTYAYNNGGIPTADFYIPGHNSEATVEILACDAELIVDGVQVLPDLLAIFDAAVKFKNAHVSDTSSLSEVEQHLALGKLMTARDELLQLVGEAIGDKEK